MSVTIDINGLTLCHKGSTGFTMATVPDVCKTPSPGGPVPIPYPNIARSSDLAKGTRTVSADGGNMCANKPSMFVRSTGDEPGTAGGVKSGVFTKEATWITYSLDVFLEGHNACRLTDKMWHNSQNTVNAGGEMQPDIVVQSLKEICEVMCYCNQNPDVSPAGREGRQDCTTRILKERDRTGTSHIKADQPYNMSPPGGGSPVPTSSRVGVRIPDAVIVNNPALPPIQSNLLAVVEIKFPGDTVKPYQISDDAEIAGENASSGIITVEMCGCRQEKQRRVKVPEPNAFLQFLAILASIALSLAFKRPVRVPAY